MNRQDSGSYSGGMNRYNSEQYDNAKAPPYEPSDTSSRQRDDRGEGSSGRQSGPDVSDRNRNAYAMTLQRACKSAVQQVKSDHMIANSNWAGPLATAPSAVSTMAILFKAGGSRAAAGLKVESTEVLQDGKLAGRLPSEYFHTNLQHCSDLGRLAFQDAQHGMKTISMTARSIISETGSLGYIIDLLEDPDEARYNLKTEIEAMKGSAKKCEDAATMVTDKFKYWYLVICHLKEVSLSKGGEIVELQKENRVLRARANDSAYEQDQKRIALESEIATIKTQIREAEHNVDRAQREYDYVYSQPQISEPSYLAEIASARKHVRHRSPPKPRSRGMLKEAWYDLVGEPSSVRAREEEELDAHHARQANEEAELLRQARQDRQDQRDRAADRLHMARDHEDKMIEQLHAKSKALSNSEYNLAEARANLERTRTDMQLLENKEIELDAIVHILDDSKQQLGVLKEQIEPIVDFFRDVLGQIDQDVNNNLPAFLRPILNRMQDGSTPEEIAALDLSKKSKDRIMSVALQMQGRFSAISDVADAYVKVSIDYIRPAIVRMEQLSDASDEDWPQASKEFMRLCGQALGEIHDFAGTTNATVERNMISSVNDLSRRAITAAEE